MASVSASQLIVFIATLMVASSVAMTLSASVLDINNAVSARGTTVADKIGTDVEILSDPGSPEAIYNASTDQLTVLVKNSGERDMDADADEVDLFVDGEYVVVDTVTRVDNASAPGWVEGSVVRVNATTTLPAGEHDVRVVVSGDEDRITFWS